MTTADIDFSTIPDSPGVYRFIDEDNTVLYIGKAASLRKRLRQYFTGTDSRGERIFTMVKKAKRVETEKTPTVLDALIVEANHIKKFLPHYNVNGKDHKSWAFLLITKEMFPRPLILRETQADAFSAPILHRFGPFVSSKELRTALKLLRKIFPFHDSKEQTERGCLASHIGLCPGPYKGKITPELYRENIRAIVEIFSGHLTSLIAQWEKKMKAAAREERFEEAMHLRNIIFTLTHLQDHQILCKQSFTPINPSQQFWGKVEGYDISTISGTSTVGSMVVFNNREPQKNSYRRFAVPQDFTDDTAALRNVLSRRLHHTEWPLPQLILVDGGSVQVHAVERVLSTFGIHVALAGVCKGPRRKRADIVPSTIFPPTPAMLADTELHRAVRDEAHRFAITYHRKKRSKKLLVEEEH